MKYLVRVQTTDGLVQYGQGLVRSHSFDLVPLTLPLSLGGQSFVPSKILVGRTRGDLHRHHRRLGHHHHRAVQCRLPR